MMMLSYGTLIIGSLLCFLFLVIFKKLGKLYARRPTKVRLCSILT